MFVFVLHQGREKSLLRRHPWIFSKALNFACTVKHLDDLADLPETPVDNLPLFEAKAIDKHEIPAGTLCAVVDAYGHFLCQAHYAPKSQIALRALTFTKEAIDYDFVRNRLAAAFARRKINTLRGDAGIRLVSAEGDYFPGLIIDRYNNVLSLAFSSWGMESLYESIIRACHELCPECYLYERSDAKSRAKEGLPLRCGIINPLDPSVEYNLKTDKGHPVQGSKQVHTVPHCTDPKLTVTVDEAIPDTLYVRERDLIEIPIDVKRGHKTGGYLDQRASRYHCYEVCQQLKALSDNGKTGPRVLNCFSYTGGFGLAALKGGASAVVNVDVSEHALEAARAGVVHNHLDPGRCKFVKKDVFAYLREEVAKGTKFDLVILDPPKFAESKSTLTSACRGYQDINRLGMQLVAPGGHLLTFSCSGLMVEELFQKIVADAALDAKVDAQIVSTLRQDIDHLVSLPCPETFYLKGFDILIN